MSIPGSGSPLLLATTAAAAAADAAYVIPKSLRFNNSDSATLTKTFATAGNRRTWTWSGWVKKCKFTTSQAVFSASNYATGLYINDTNNNGEIVVDFSTGTTSSTRTLRYTTRLFRDPSAWYHIVYAVDTTQATGSDRLKLYVNGELQTLDNIVDGTWPTQDGEGHINDAIAHGIGYRINTSDYYFNGLLADVQFVDGQQLAATDFGEPRESDGVWVPKEASFTSINDGTTWSANVSASTGSVPYATLGFDGNTTTAAYASSTASDTYIYVDFSPALSGTFKLWHSMSSGSPTAIVTHSGGSSTVSVSTGGASLGAFTSVSRIAINRGEAATHSFQAIAVDGVILVDNVGKYGKNGFHLNFSDSSTNEALGFDSAPTIPALDPKKGMDIVTYTGDGTSDRKIGGLNFEPGLVWIKRYNSTAKDHCLVDVVRGPKKRLRIESTAQETTEEVVTAFDPGGFTIGTDTGVNQSGAYNYVAWAWAAGGPAVSNTSGTINAEVSANTDYGFSIVKWTATNASGTIGHGLTNQTPKFILVKSTAVGTNWVTYHHSLGNTKGLNINLSGTGGTDQDFWNNTSPTTSVFSVGSFANYQTAEHVAYVWSEVSGFSKFGTYEGTGSAGFAVTTGFKPRFVIIKNVDNTGNWRLYDTERDATSPSTSILFANTNAAQSTTAHPVRMLEDGFQIEGTHVDINTSGETYIYAAWADRPGNNFDVNNIVTNEGLSTSKSQFDVVTYTGNGTTQSITSLAFQPDLVWIKDRSNAYSHRIADSVRGSTRVLFSDQTNAEQVNEYGTIDQFTSNGFDLRQGSNNNGDGSNTNGANMVAWCWKAGGTAVSNTDGSITSSVSANPSHGFSIVSWDYDGTTGQYTVGHGLNTAPSMIIVRPREITSNWGVYHSALGNTAGINLNQTNAPSTSTGWWNNTSPTDSVFTLSTFFDDNSEYIAYCFADVPGYQRTGKYSGTGSTQTIVCGFKPKFVMVKNITVSNDNWYIFDSERLPNTVWANGQNAESSSYASYFSGFTNTGFTVTGSNQNTNSSSHEYIFWAIGDDEIGSDEDCLVDVPNAVTADASTTDTTGGYQRGNYATLNPLEIGSNTTFSNGNLEVVSTNTSGWRSHCSTIAVSSGKYYFEADCTAGSVFSIGIAHATDNIRDSYTTDDTPAYAYNYNGKKYSGGTSDDGTAGASFTAGDLIGVAFDLDNGEIEFFKNGVSQGTFYTNVDTTVSYKAVVSTRNSTIKVNFGQMRFKYLMPSGYAALNTTALPAATIEDGSAYFATKLYTGNGGTLAVTGLEFSPDWVWYKRYSAATSHFAYDQIRGTGATAELVPSATYTEGSVADTDAARFGYLHSFDSNGFTVKAGTTNGVYANQSGGSYVSWNWDGGSSTVSNTDGSVTSSVRANTTAGFSIVTASPGGAATIGHGLNAAPEFIICKSRTVAYNWAVYHSALGRNQTLSLNLTDAAQSISGFWGSSEPTSSVFGVGSGSSTNNAGNMVYYCFAPVAGYSAFGSYIGNGSSSDGPFVHLGFRPALIIFRNTGGPHIWGMYDSARDTYNVADQFLRANGSEAVGTAVGVDFLSNGFKIRGLQGFYNQSGATILYMAWAENPFQANGGLAR